MYLWTRVQFLATDFRRLRCVSSAYAYTRNQYSFFEREQLFRSRNCSTTHGGQIFSVPLFIPWKALFLRASAFCLVDATGRIPLLFVLRDHISLFFLCWLVDVSMS